MARQARLQVAFGGDEGLLGGPDAVVARQRRLDPVLFAGGLRIDDRQAGGQRVNLVVRLSGQRAQTLEENPLVALGLDPIDDNVVELGLGIEHIGDRHEAHVEALLHLFELSAHSLFGRYRGLQGRLAAQYVEIGLGNARNELLRGRLEIPLRLPCDCAGTEVVEPSGHVDDGLVQVRAPTAPGDVSFGKRHAALVEPVDVDRRLRRAGTGAQARQQRRPGLDHDFLA